MCLPNFVEFKTIQKSEALTGYRFWTNEQNKLELKSQQQDYVWPTKVVSHRVKEENSGIYSYNNNYYNYYNKYYNYYNYNNYYNNYNNIYDNYYNYNNYNIYNNYNYYYLSGIILQYGKVAIHKTGYRSQYAKVKTLFTIRESDAEGPSDFIAWISKFNQHIQEIAKKYSADTMRYQDFIENNK